MVLQLCWAYSISSSPQTEYGKPMTRENIPDTNNRNVISKKRLNSTYFLQINHLASFDTLLVVSKLMSSKVWWKGQGKIWTHTHTLRYIAYIKVCLEPIIVRNTILFLPIPSGNNFLSIFLQCFFFLNLPTKPYTTAHIRYHSNIYCILPTPLIRTTVTILTNC